MRIICGRKNMATDHKILEDLRQKIEEDYADIKLGSGSVGGMYSSLSSG